MSTKQTLGLLVLAIALIALALFTRKREEAVVAEAAAPTRTILSGLTSGTIERIQIQPAAETSVTLIKRDGTWYTNLDKKWKADKNLVSSLFGAIEKEVTGEVVSSNPTNFEKYEVTDTSATHVLIFGAGDKSLADLYVGKAGASFFSTFIRKAGTEEVVDANAALAQAFNKPEGWRDRAIFEIPSHTITAIANEGSSGTFTLRKAGEKWMIEGANAGEAQPAKVQPLVNRIATLRTMDFAELDSTHTLAAIGLDPPRQKVTIFYEDRSTSPAKEVSSILLIGNKREDNDSYFAKRPDSEDIYVLQSYDATQLVPNPADLKLAQPAPQPPPAQPAPASNTAITSEPTKQAEAPKTEKTEPATTETTKPQAPEAPKVEKAEPATTETAKPQAPAEAAKQPEAPKVEKAEPVTTETAKSESPTTAAPAEQPAQIKITAAKEPQAAPPVKTEQSAPTTTPATGVKIEDVKSKP